MYMRRSLSVPKISPKRLAGWYGNQLWLWRGKPLKLTLVRITTCQQCLKGT